MKLAYWILLTATLFGQENVRYYCSCTNGDFANLNECLRGCNAPGKGRLGCFVGVCIEGCAREAPQPFTPNSRNVLLEKWPVPPGGAHWDDSILELGRTGPQSVDVVINARCDGKQWVGQLKSIKGLYYRLVRPIPPKKRVTSETTNEQTYCAQLGSLQTLTRLTQLSVAPDLPWIAESTVDAHELAHYARLRPALEAVSPQIAARVEQIVIPFAKAHTREDALQLMQPSRQSIKDLALRAWADEFTKLSKSDEEAGGAGERAMVDDVAQISARICATAKAKGWAVCEICP